MEMATAGVMAAAALAVVVLSSVVRSAGRWASWPRCPTGCSPIGTGRGPWVSAVVAGGLLAFVIVEETMV